MCDHREDSPFHPRTSPCHDRPRVSGLCAIVKPHPMPPALILIFLAFSIAIFNARGPQGNLP